MLLGSLGKQGILKGKLTVNRAPVQRPKSLSEIEGSTRILLNVIDPDAKFIPYTWTPFYIDVRDIALAHYKAALATPEAGNQRYLIAGPGVETNKLVQFYPGDGAEI